METGSAMNDSEDRGTQYRELLLGCGRTRDKRLVCPNNMQQAWLGLVTCDISPDVDADVVMNLEGGEEWPWDDDYFDEVHAYEVLEHLGRQGDVVRFFSTFADIYRVLKPGGFLAATVPSRFSPWLWADPGHTRAILPESLHFLKQETYAQCDGLHPTAMSDYRPIWSGDFDIIRSDDDKRLHRFILQAVKPARRV
jgi:SAM-dependent methyltransferase